MNKNILRTAGALGLLTLAGCNNRVLNPTKYTLDPNTTSFSQLQKEFSEIHAPTLPITIQNTGLWRKNTAHVSAYEDAHITGNSWYGEVTIFPAIQYYTKNLSRHKINVQWQARVFDPGGISEMTQSVSVGSATSATSPSDIPLENKSYTAYKITYGNNGNHPFLKKGSTIFIEGLNPYTAKPVPSTAIVFSIK